MSENNKFKKLLEPLKEKNFIGASAMIQRGAPYELILVTPLIQNEDDILKILELAIEDPYIMKRLLITPAYKDALLKINKRKLEEKILMFIQDINYKVTIQPNDRTNRFVLISKELLFNILRQQRSLDDKNPKFAQQIQKRNRKSTIQHPQKAKKTPQDPDNTYTSPELQAIFLDLTNDENKTRPKQTNLKDALMMDEINLSRKNHFDLEAEIMDEINKLDNSSQNSSNLLLVTLVFFLKKATNQQQKVNILSNFLRKYKLSNEDYNKLLTDRDISIDINQKNKDGYTLLFLAMSLGQPELVEELVKSPKLQVNDTELFDAVKLKQYKMISHLLCTGSRINPNQQNKEGDTPLHVAIKEGDLFIVNSLLKIKKIDLNKKNNQGNTPLHEAIINRNWYIVKALLKYYKENNLNIDIKNNLQHTPLELLLNLAKQREVNAISTLELLRNIPTVDMLDLPRNSDRDLEVIMLDELKANASKDVYEGTAVPLYAVVNFLKTGNSAQEKANIFSNFLRKHILSRADYKTLLTNQHIDINQKDQQGYTPLFLAINAGDYDLVDELIRLPQLDVNVTCGTARDTALFHAVQLNQNRMIAHLLCPESRIDPNQQNTEGDTALHVAIRTGSWSAANALLRIQTIDINKKNNSQLTPLELLLNLAKTGNENAIFSLKTFLKKTNKRKLFDILETTIIKNQPNYLKILLENVDEKLLDLSNIIRLLKEAFTQTNREEDKELQHNHSLIVNILLQLLDNASKYRDDNELYEIIDTIQNPDLKNIVWELLLQKYAASNKLDLWIETVLDFFEQLNNEPLSDSVKARISKQMQTLQASEKLLLAAVKNGNIETVEKVLKVTGNNYQNMQPIDVSVLKEALATDELDIVKALLRADGMLKLRGQPVIEEFLLELILNEKQQDGRTLPSEERFLKIQKIIALIKPISISSKFFNKLIKTPGTQEEIDTIVAALREADPHTRDKILHLTQSPQAINPPPQPPSSPATSTNTERASLRPEIVFITDNTTPTTTRISDLPLHNSTHTLFQSVLIRRLRNVQNLQELQQIQEQYLRNQSTNSATTSENKDAQISFILELFKNNNHNLMNLLHLAATRNNVDIINFLQQTLTSARDNGLLTTTDISAYSNMKGGTPEQMSAIEFAAKNGHIEAVEALLKFEGINIIENNCCKALELAIQNGYPEIVKILLDKLSELLDDPLNSTDFSKLFKTANKVLQEPLNAVKSDYKYKTQLRDAKEIAETALKETETKFETYKHIQLLLDNPSHTIPIPKTKVDLRSGLGNTTPLSPRTPSRIILTPIALPTTRARPKAPKGRKRPQ